MADHMYDDSPMQDVYDERRPRHKYSRSPTPQGDTLERRTPPPADMSPMRSPSPRGDYDRRDPSRDRSRRRSRSPRPHYRDTRGRDYERTRELAKKYRPQAPPRAARENPEPSTVLGVFNLNYNTTEKDLEEVFSKYPSLEKTVVVVDHKLRRSRGFAFVYFSNLEDATAARNETNGMTLMNRVIRVDFSVTQGPHDPTPGLYMGPRHDSRRVDRYSSRNRSRDRDRGRHYGRYRSRSRSRSRSRDRRRDRRMSPRRTYDRSPRRHSDRRSPYRRDNDYSR